MPDVQRQPVGLHLAWLLSVIIAEAFVTVLIVVTGDVATYWPLYLVPIVLAALAYHAAGAIVSVAVSGAIVALLVYGGDYEAPALSSLIAGAIAFTVSGLVVGIQTERYRQQRKRLERDTTRDTLTGSYCADYFSSRLAEELRRAGRYDVPCTLALVRPSDFARFVHVYGRVKSDLLLARFADVIDLTIRDTDIFGRLEGELFATLLVATTPDDAVEVTVRIVEAIRATEFEGDALEPVVHCDAERAVAVFPVDGADAAELLRTARERLGPASPVTTGHEEGGRATSFSDLSDVPS